MEWNKKTKEESDNNVFDQLRAEKLGRRNKILKSIGGVLIIALVVAGGLFLLKSFRQNTTKTIIGDTLVKREDIIAYQKALQATLDQATGGGSLGEDKTLFEVASDDITLNTMLKYYAKPEQCGVSVTALDILQDPTLTISRPINAENPEETLIEEYGEYSLHNPARIRAENSTYKAKLQECLIGHKKILSVLVQYYDGYFKNEDGAYNQAHVEEVMNFFKTKLLPLFDNNAPATEIAAHVTCDHVNGTYIDSPICNLGQYEDDTEGYLWAKNQLAISAEIETIAQGIPYMDASEPDDLPSYFGEQVLKNEVATNLTEIGQNSGVIVARDGTISILRLEEIGGKFTSYDELIKSVQDEHPQIFSEQDITALLGSRDLFTNTASAFTCADLQSSEYHPKQLQITFYQRVNGVDSPATNVVAYSEMQHDRAIPSPLYGCDSKSAAGGTITTYYSCMTYNQLYITLHDGWEFDTTAGGGRGYTSAVVNDDTWTTEGMSKLSIGTSEITSTSAYLKIKQADDNVNAKVGTYAINFWVKGNIPNEWDLQTGSWGQGTNGANPSDGAWSRTTTTQESTLFFTHSAGVARLSGNAGMTNDSSQWNDVAHNVDISFDMKVYDVTSDLNNTVELPNTRKIEAIGGPTNLDACTPQATNYWDGTGWKLGDFNSAGTLSVALINFSKASTLHYGLRASAPKESNMYLCKFEPHIPAGMPSNTKLKFVSKITMSNAAGMETDEGVTKEEATTSAEIIWGGPPEWSVETKSFAMVTNLSGMQAPTCSGSGQYCPGPAGVGSGNITQDEATIYVAAAPDSNDGGSMELNFRHIVEVKGDQDTGDILSDSQLWFYKIRNWAYEGNNNVNLLSYGCLSHTGFGADNGNVASFNGDGTIQQWNPVVLEHGKAYDILSRTKSEVSSDGSQGNVLCTGGNIRKPADENIEKAKYRSTVYLCFSTGSGYKYRYGAEMSNDYTTAKRDCESALQRVTNTQWNASGGRDTTLVTSTATVLFEKGNCNDPVYAAAHPEECDTPESEVAISKTQTCAINDTIGEGACDPSGTRYDNPKPDEFEAIETDTDNGTEGHDAPTQLARPGDIVYFEHFFDKAAQQLAETTTWRSIEFNASHCRGEGDFYYNGNMPATSINCLTRNGHSDPNERMEVVVAHSHSSATDLTGSGTASGHNVLDIADSCFYNGKNGENNISIHTDKTGVPAFSSLGSITNCSNNANLASVPTNTRVNVLGEDVGSRELYQKVTLFDRVSQKLANCRGEGSNEQRCVAEYPRAGQKEGATDISTNTGEDNVHEFTIKWQDYHSGTCGGGTGEFCNYACTADYAFYGSIKSTTPCCGCAPNETTYIHDNTGGLDSDGWDGSGTYKEYEHTWVKMVDDGPVSSNAQFNIPYNYRLNPEILPTDLPGKMIIGGSEWDYETWIDVEEVVNEEFGGDSYATTTRPGTRWQVTEFYIEETVTEDPNPEDRYTSESNPCFVYVNAGNARIQNVSDTCYPKRTGGRLNDDDDRFGRPRDAYNSDTAFVEDAPPGTKFCIGLSVMDYASYDFDNRFGLSGDHDQTYGDGMHNWWLHLKPECVSISKIPTMQVWGGGLYAEGPVIGKYAVKKTTVTDETGTSERWVAFDSWSEYSAIGSLANGLSPDSTSKLFGSAAAFGQGLIVDPLSSPQNGCTYAKLHFANAATNTYGNSVCFPTENPTTGNTNIFKGLAKNMVLRYTNRLQGNKWATAEVTKIDSITDPDLVKGDWYGGTIAPKDNAITYYHYDGDTHIDTTTNIGDPTDPIKGKTVIVEIEGKATIKGNITYTDKTLNSIYEIPQVIIFAEDIDIEPQVTQIDAWLMVGLNGGGGVINTCANGITESTLTAANRVYNYPNDGTIPLEGSDVPTASKECNSRLKINGPVQAKKLRLLRSYGAGMGLEECEYSYDDTLAYNHDRQAQWPNGGRTGVCGSRWGGVGPFPYDSATPAEVFNLRADAYLWAYRQVENYSQAFVTFEREVAPRY
jgi:hypothetical protein